MIRARPRYRGASVRQSHSGFRRRSARPISGMTWSIC